MRKRNIFFRIIFALVASIFVCTPFAVQNYNLSASAASPVDYSNFSGKHVAPANSNEQDTVNLIVDGDNYSNTLYLYPNANSVTAMTNIFGYHTTAGSSISFSSNGSKLEFKVTSASTSSTARRGNVKVYSTLNLSNNIVIAANQGYVSTATKAKYASASNIYKGLITSDKADTVSMDFYIYDSNNTSSSKTDGVAGEIRDGFKDSFDVISFDSESIKNLNANTVELVFTCLFNGGTFDATANYLQVESPEISFSTSDRTIPTVALEGGSESWAMFRTLQLSATDAESGVYKIEVKKDDGEWQDAIDFTKDNTDYHTENSGEFVITENGTYTFRSYDNVGNVSEEITYTESHIDTEVPNIETENLSGLYLGLSMNFDANLISDGLNENNFIYTLSLGGNVVSSGEILNTTNISVSEAGVYTLSLKAIDEAGNVFESESYTLIFAKIGVQDFYTSNSVDFDAVVTSNGLDAYTFSIKVLGEDTDLTYTVVNGRNEFNLAKNGKYTLNFEFVATNGNVTYSAGTKAVDIDNTIYYVSTNAVNGTIDDSYSSLRASGETISFAPKAGYEFYKLEVNGEIVDLEENATEYVFELDRNLEIVAYFRKTISVEISSNYVYNYGKLDVDFETEIEKELVTFKVFDEAGLEISDVSMYHFNAGTYEIFYLIDTDEYAGRGNQTITISQKQVEISDVKYVYSYSVNGVNFEFTSSESLAEVYAYFGEDVEFLNAGEYNFTLKCKNDNFKVDMNGTAVILPVIASVSGNNVTFDGTSHTLELKVLGGGEEFIVLEIYNGLNKVDAFDAGNYSVEIYFNPNGTAYKLGVENLNISKRNIEVVANSFEHTYDGAVPLEKTGYTVKGLEEGATLSFELDLSAFSKDVGEYEISIKELTAGTENYLITYVSGTASIVARLLQVISVEGQSKVYGENDPTNFKYTILSQIVEGEEGLISIDIARVAGEDAGYYDFYVESYTAPNYEINFTSNKFQITKRLAFITLVSGEKTYGELDGAFEFISNNSNILSKDYDAVVSAIKRDAGEDAGTYKLYVDENEISNYLVISKDSTYKINKKEITVTAKSFVSTYGNVIDFSDKYEVSGLIDGDKLSGSLKKVSGRDVGEYEILLGSLANPNYVIDFVGGTVTIEARTLYISLKNTNKVYGEDDDLSYTVSGLCYDDVVLGNLERVSGEDAGVYDISLSAISAGKNYVLQLETKTYEILRKQVSVSVCYSEKDYGTDDGKFDYIVDGLVFGESLDIQFVRERGEEIGSYKISYAGGKIIGNYEIARVEENILKIVPATLNVSLKDKTLVYSGNACTIEALNLSEIDESEITYVYKSFGSVVSEAIDAGEYEVYAVFAGNEHYNAFTTSAVKLTIEKKMVPITLTNLKFIYDGEPKMPKYDVNFDINVTIIVNFEGGVTPVEVGTYKFTMVANETNYFCNTEGEIEILSSYSNVSGNSQMSADSVSFSDSGIEFVEVANSNLSSRFSSSLNGLKCLSVYAFRNIDGYENSDEVVTVSIKQTKNKNVQLYIVDSYGNMKEVSYDVVDGYYVLSVSDLTASIIVTASDNSALYTKAVLLVLILIATCFASKKIRNKKQDNFFNKNSVTRKITKAELAENESIVESVIFNDDVIDTNKFIS